MLKNIYISMYKYIINDKNTKKKKERLDFHFELGCPWLTCIAIG